MTHGNITVSEGHPGDWRAAADAGGWLLLSLSSFSLSLGKLRLVFGHGGLHRAVADCCVLITALVVAPAQVELVLRGRSGEVLLWTRGSGEWAVPIVMFVREGD